MSYCVNCGVELMRSERKCPLCGVEVINPLEPHGPGDEAFPRIREPVESAFDRGLWIKIVSIALALPAVICFTSNVVFHNSEYWSLYVIGALVVAWTFCVTPFLFKRYFPLLWIVANTGVTLGYLYLLEYLSGAGGWFLPLALPIVLGVALLSLVLIILIRLKVLRQLFTASAIFLAIGLLSVLVEVSVNHYTSGEFRMAWSWFSLISCIATAGALALIERKLILKEKLKRRLHI